MNIVKAASHVHCVLRVLRVAVVYCRAMLSTLNAHHKFHYIIIMALFATTTTTTTTMTTREPLRIRTILLVLEHLSIHK